MADSVRAEAAHFPYRTYLHLDAASVPNADAGTTRLFYDLADGVLKQKDEAGTVTTVPGGFAPDPSGEADGRMLDVQSGVYAFRDAPAGGGGGRTEHAFVTGTSFVTVTANSEATSQTILQVTVDLGADECDFTYFCPDIYLTPSGGQVIFTLWEDAVTQGQLGYGWSESGRQHYPGRMEYRYTPGAGSKTYSVRAYAPAGAPELRSGSGGTASPVPSYFRIRQA